MMIKHFFHTTQSLTFILNHILYGFMTNTADGLYIKGVKDTKGSVCWRDAECAASQPINYFSVEVEQ